MNYVILDLEWNGAYSYKVGRYFNEIIEFGAVKLDEKLNVIGQFSLLVKPELTGKLRNSVQELTSITNEELKRGVPFTYAYTKFSKFAKGCTIMSWSNTDLIVLQENSLYYYKTDRLPFVRYYMDLQEYCQDMLGVGSKNQLGLYAAAEMMEIDVEDIPHHRAVGDCIASYKCLQKVYSRSAVLSHIEYAGCDEFYRRLNFHVTYLYDLENPLINKKTMFFNCNECGARAVRQNEWTPKNKGFFADFLCPNCQTAFRGKIKYKLRYDGVTVVKKIINPQQEDSVSSDDIDTDHVEAS